MLMNELKIIINPTSTIKQSRVKIQILIFKTMTWKMLACVIVVAGLFSLSQSFIIQAKQGQTKCFKAEQSPDKTLQVKFGFPRRQRQNCDVHFSVDLVNQDQSKSNIYSDVHKCHEMNPGQPFVIKHTSQSMSMQGAYQICYEVLQDTNEQLLLEIFIGQKINPLLYSDGDDVLPLIQAEELIDLDLKVQSIRKSIGWSRKLLSESKQLGDKLQADLSQLNEFSVNATLFQIAFLALYGIAWIIFIRQQKVN